jgi:hypothetical protein
VDLVEVDVVGLQPAQGIFDLSGYSGRGGVAEDLSFLPFQTNLCGDDNPVPAAASSNSLANDLFRAAEK